MPLDQVEPQDPSCNNSPKTPSKTAEFALVEKAVCYWNDKKYSDGATVCDNHRRYECWNGKWAEIGIC